MKEYRLSYRGRPRAGEFSWSHIHMWMGTNIWGVGSGVWFCVCKSLGFWL